MTENPLETQATQAALEADWEKAITLNKEILKSEPENLGALNRLGRAYSEVGQLDKAKSSYREVLKHDPYNSIALKNLERLKAANGHASKMTGSTALSPDLFLETPGKTKVLELGDLAKPEVLALLHTGDKVKIVPNESSVRFEDASGTRLGVYKGDLAAKLSEMLRSGNVYEAYVKSVKPTELRIFVRETARTPRFAGTPSFPITDNGFKPYVHEGVVANEPIESGFESTAEATAEEAKPKPAKEASVEALAESESEEIKEDN